MLRILLVIAATVYLSACGSLPNYGPFYTELEAACSAAGQSGSCASTDSKSLEFSKDKLTKYAKHFTDTASARADRNFMVGNVGVGAAIVGVISAIGQSRDGVIASTLVGVPSALFGQRYNLSGQSTTYLRGADAFECMRQSVHGLEDYQGLVDKLRASRATLSTEATNAEKVLTDLPREIDGRISTLVRRTVRDLINGVSAVDTAAIGSAFERYFNDVNKARDKISSTSLFQAPAASPAPAGALKAPAPLLLTVAEMNKLNALAISLLASKAELDKCVTQ